MCSYRVVRSQLCKLLLRSRHTAGFFRLSKKPSNNFQNYENLTPGIEWISLPQFSKWTTFDSILVHMSNWTIQYFCWPLLRIQGTSLYLHTWVEWDSFHVNLCSLARKNNAWNMQIFGKQIPKWMARISAQLSASPLARVESDSLTHFTLISIKGHSLELGKIRGPYSYML